MGAQDDQIVLALAQSAQDGNGSAEGSGVEMSHSFNLRFLESFQLTSHQVPGVAVQA